MLCASCLEGTAARTRLLVCVRLAALVSTKNDSDTLTSISVSGAAGGVRSRDQSPLGVTPSKLPGGCMVCVCVVWYFYALHDSSTHAYIHLDYTHTHSCLLSVALPHTLQPPLPWTSTLPLQVSI